MMVKYRGNRPECARAWIADSDFFSYVLWQLCRAKPEEAWAIIKEIYEQHPSEDTSCRLALGPLEDLLFANGERVIDRVEELGQREERFARVLAQVPQRGMPDEVWRRLRGAVEKWPGANPPEHPTDTLKKAPKAKAKRHEQTGLGL
jgi:hypothetical protein